MPSSLFSISGKWEENGMKISCDIKAKIFYSIYSLSTIVRPWRTQEEGGRWILCSWHFQALNHPRPRALFHLRKASLLCSILTWSSLSSLQVGGWWWWAAETVDGKGRRRWRLEPGEGRKEGRKMGKSLPRLTGKEKVETCLCIKPFAQWLPSCRRAELPIVPGGEGSSPTTAPSFPNSHRTGEETMRHWWKEPTTRKTPCTYTPYLTMHSYLKHQRRLFAPPAWPTAAFTTYMHPDQAAVVHGEREICQLSFIQCMPSCRCACIRHYSTAVPSLCLLHVAALAIPFLYLPCSYLCGGSSVSSSVGEGQERQPYLLPCICVWLMTVATGLT